MSSALATVCTSTPGIWLRLDGRHFEFNAVPMNLPREQWGYLVKA